MKPARKGFTDNLYLYFVHFNKINKNKNKINACHNYNDIRIILSIIAWVGYLFYPQQLFHF